MAWEGKCKKKKTVGQPLQFCRKIYALQSKGDTKITAGNVDPGSSTMNSI